MSDEFDLDALKSAMNKATPAPDPVQKAANLRLAEENFAALQESRDATRLTPDRPERRGLFAGARQMMNSISMKGVLGATTAIAAIGMVALVMQPGAVPDISGPGVVTVKTDDAETTEETRADLREAVGDVIEIEEPIMAEPVMEAEPTLADGMTATAPAANTLSLGQDTQGFAAASPRRERGGVALETVIAPPPDLIVIPEANTEEFANDAPNPLKITSEEPVSTFSIDVDTASYSVMRSSLMNGYMPNPESVRVEELINYFPYDYAAPDGDMPFSQTVTVTPTPWNAGTRLVHIGIQGQLPEIAARPPLNLVFLIDTSGSMNDSNKLPLLIQSFRLMLSELRPEDQVAIVTYAGSAGQVLAPTPAGERTTIMNALNQLHAGGSTAGQAGLQQAYAVAETMAEEGEVTRVILATDGDFNVGIHNPEELKTYIEEKRESGTYLSVLGFGRGNLDDATMQALAQNGNGTAAYIDTLSEARKVLVDQLSGALFPIADDVKIQVEWNPAEIAEYRLIGYETRALAHEDFNNDAVDAGEIGAGHSVTAIYEVTPVGSDAILNDALRYQPVETAESNGEYGYLKFRHKAPGEDTSVLTETPILPDMGNANADTRFATAIAGFGQLLRGSTYLGDWSYADAIALANANRGEDPFGYRTEAVTLMRLAETLAQN